MNIRCSSAVGLLNLIAVLKTRLGRSLNDNQINHRNFAPVRSILQAREGDGVKVPVLKITKNAHVSFKKESVLNHGFP